MQDCTNGCKIESKKKKRQINGYVPHIADQEEPKCQMCNNAAFYDPTTGKYSPGCTISHINMSRASGFTGPR